MKLIDALLNRITMYRLVVYVLAIEALAGVALAFDNELSMAPGSMILSLVLLIGGCYVTDRVLSKVWRAPYNKESWLISALIIFLILRPPTRLGEAVAVLLAAVIASASKYILSWRGKHIFNPAAFAAAFMSLSTLQTTTWWIGNAQLWPLTLMLGLLVVRKIRRFRVVLSFVLVSVGLQIYLFLSAHQPLNNQLKSILIASPLIFLSTIMLTEPATMPPRRNQQIVFAAIVAVLYVEAWKIGPLYIYPEVALLLGNLFAFVLSPKFKTKLRLKQIQRISDQVYSFVFTPTKKFNFIPGQYMEWTLAGVPFDARGNRRTFTIASSPTESEIQIGVKFYNPSSAFKYALSRLSPGDYVYASQLAGNFTLSGNERKKLAFIAGGIGVTPFRSMVKYLNDQKINCDIILIYVVSKAEELAYKSEFLAAKDLGVKLVPVLTTRNSQAEGMVSGNISAKLISRFVPDFKQRIFYVSGPDAMVTSTSQLLHQMGVSRVKTDHFAGY